MRKDKNKNKNKNTIRALPQFGFLGMDTTGAADDDATADVSLRVDEEPGVDHGMHTSSAPLARATLPVNATRQRTRRQPSQGRPSPALQ